MANKDNDENTVSLERMWTLLRVDSGESEADMRTTSKRQSRRAAQRARQRREREAESKFDDGAESFLDTICGEELSDRMGRACDILFLMGPEEEEEVQVRSPKPKRKPKQTEELATFDLQQSFSGLMESRDAEEEKERPTGRKGWFGRQLSKRRVSSGGRA